MQKFVKSETNILRFYPKLKVVFNKRKNAKIVSFFSNNNY